MGCGLPVTSVLPTPRRPGAFIHFSSGSIYWSPATGAHLVVGAIYARWASMGWETGAPGFPTSDECPVPGGARSDVEGAPSTGTPPAD